MWRLALVLVAAVAVFAPTPSGGGTAAPELAYARAGDIWTIGADGTRARPLLRDAYAPSWSPDGSRLAFVSRRSGDEEMYLAFTKGSDRVLGDDSMLDFSPDGRRIAFTSNRDQQGEIYVMNADGSGQQRLTRRAGEDWAPAFSPDSARIAFTQLPSTIWTMNADGTGLRKLTAGTDADWRR
jgi:Tol biopolymer transport system component